MCRHLSICFMSFSRFGFDLCAFQCLFVATFECQQFDLCVCVCVCVQLVMVGVRNVDLCRSLLHDVLFVCFCDEWLC